MTQDLEAVEVLIRARGLLKRVGWIQNHYEGPGGYCSTGAINASSAQDQNGWTISPRVRAKELLRQCIGGANIAQWNDRDGRQKSEVLMAFDCAIEKGQQHE